ncbi:helix-turn-helix domain-containing protein [Pseudopelagicola sp. nBUS_20]|uniref:helix-turn-helix domain-containing protein n=1 Tax=Pseudopelagicola sp. nBUS_20 TaxID=3395317 RepID=UPI003EC0E694
MVKNISLVRAAYVIDYISVMRDGGAQVEGLLAESLLPTNIEFVPQLFVSFPIALNWVAKAGHEQNPMELGLRASEHVATSSFYSLYQEIVGSTPSGIKRLEALLMAMRQEDRTLKLSVVKSHKSFEIKFNLLHREHRYICFQEWVLLQTIISVMRSIKGQSWCPDAMCFASHIRPPKAVVEKFPGTRILIRCSHTSITILRKDLVDTFGKVGASGLELNAFLPSKVVYREALGGDLVDFVRTLVKPYLGEALFRVETVAEIIGISKRTLQRSLHANDSSYSQILREARFELASDYLSKGSIKITDVAMTLGYQRVQNFSRDFRKQTGMTPSQYRKKNEPAPG